MGKKKSKKNVKNEGMAYPAQLNVEEMVTGNCFGMYHIHDVYNYRNLIVIDGRKNTKLVFLCFEPVDSHNAVVNLIDVTWVQSLNINILPL